MPQKNSLHFLTLAAAIVALTAMAGHAQTSSAASNASTLAAYTPQPGHPHPDFLLPSIDDRQPVSLSQFRGKKVLLIHFASW